jgi:hypothetical protein
MADRSIRGLATSQRLRVIVLQPRRTGRPNRVQTRDWSRGWDFWWPSAKTSRAPLWSISHMVGFTDVMTRFFPRRLAS